VSALTGRQIARAAGIVMLAYVASGVLGIVRNAAISYAFGAGYLLFPPNLIIMFTNK
jgi:peptidoglycan biosynthesis protein MviN/MurJ (putative lipid II flippase)